MDKDLKYRTVCPLCGKSFDSRDGKFSPDGKVVCQECYDRFGFRTYMVWGGDYPEDEMSEKKPYEHYPNFVPKDWRDCYKLPLHLDEYRVYARDADDNAALGDFNLKYDERGNYLPGERERINHIVDVINGDCSSNFDSDWGISNDNPCKITYKGEYQFSVRGWSHLKDRSSLNLPAKLAAKMQDGFINYIIGKLNGGRNNMKKFSLDEYLKNPGRKIVTRDGHNARIISTDRKSPTGHNIVVLMDYGNEEISTTCNNNGETEFCSPFQSKGDLFFASEKKEGWVNIYKYNSKITTGSLVYNTKEEAESAKGNRSDYISTIKIEWEE